MIERFYPIARKVLLPVSAAGIVIALNFGIDYESRSVNAADNTPTVTSTPTTPGIWLTVTAEANKLKQDQEIADARSTLTAIARQRGTLQNPSTETSTPLATKTPLSPAAATATGETIRLDVLAKRQAEIKATATADANLTATFEAKKTAEAATATSVPKSESSSGGGAAPWQCIGGLVLAGVACLVPIVIGVGSAAAIAGATAGYSATREGRGKIRWVIGATRMVVNFIRARRAHGNPPPAP